MVFNVPNGPKWSKKFNWIAFKTRFNLVLVWSKIVQVLTKNSSKWVRHNQVSWSSLFYCYSLNEEEEKMSQAGKQNNLLVDLEGKYWGVLGAGGASTKLYPVYSPPQNCTPSTALQRTLPLPGQVHSEIRSVQGGESPSHTYKQGNKAATLFGWTARAGRGFPHPLLESSWPLSVNIIPLSHPSGVSKILTANVGCVWGLKIIIIHIQITKLQKK